jgi:hypothetical protein
MLIWGDNKLVMASLLKDFQGQDRSDLHRSSLRRGGGFHDAGAVGEKKRRRERSILLEMVAYRDSGVRELIRTCT